MKISTFQKDLAMVRFEGPSDHIVMVPIQPEVYELPNTDQMIERILDDAVESASSQIGRSVGHHELLYVGMTQGQLYLDNNTSIILCGGWSDKEIKEAEELRQAFEGRYGTT